MNPYGGIVCIEKRVPVGIRVREQKAIPLSTCRHPICSQTFLCASVAPPINHYHRNYCILGSHVLVCAIIHHPSQPPSHPLDKLIKCKLDFLPPHTIQTIVWHIVGLNNCVNKSIRIY